MYIKYFITLFKFSHLDQLQVSLLSEYTTHFACLDVETSFMTSITIANVGDDIPSCVDCKNFLLQTYLSEDALLDGSDIIINKNIHLEEGNQCFTEYLRKAVIENENNLDQFSKI